MILLLNILLWKIDIQQYISRLYILAHDGSARHAGNTPAVDDHTMAMDVAGQFRYQE